MEFQNIDILKKCLYKKDDICRAGVKGIKVKCLFFATDNKCLIDQISKEIEETNKRS